ncbi:peptidylprolyl isomerase [uncultured Psychroserpens sp.]|uniref:peptidylprolyl isomerase n=1 Tax=uncultured Psychroserpens sp. TaxID=255436 RepID=UPI0026260798|nr:peptidylprolyl isomerase [uncultured Psychroserpens sp.]
MFKKTLIVLLSLTATISFAQNNFEKELDSIQTETDAKTYIENNKSINGKVIVFNKKKHNTRLAQELFRLGNGSKKVYKTDSEKTYYKVIEKNNIPYQRVSYIFLDGNKKSVEDINSLRKSIITKYNDGFRFNDLAKHYSMDDNAKRGGDLGWVTSGDLHPDFEAQVLNDEHDINSIFTVDIPEQKWYYVILKTEATKYIEEIKVLKVSEPIK